MDPEKQALNLLRKHSKGWSHRFVFWSGGKDSTVALHLTLRAWQVRNVRVVFVDTGITLPETLEYVQRIARESELNLTILKPEIDFWKYVKKYGFPAIPYYLWCRRLLKMKPIKEFMKSNHGWKVQVLGIRKAESTARMKSDLYDRPFKRNLTIKFTYNLCPTLEWSDEQRNRYIKKHEIPVNPCYELYGSSGCYFCPFICNPSHYLKLRYRHPNLFQNIVDAETAIKRPSWKALKNLSIQELTKQQFLFNNT